MTPPVLFTGSVEDLRASIVLGWFLASAGELSSRGDPASLDLKGVPRGLLSAFVVELLCMPAVLSYQVATPGLPVVPWLLFTAYAARPGASQRKTLLAGAACGAALAFLSAVLPVEQVLAAAQAPWYGPAIGKPFATLTVATVLLSFAFSFGSIGAFAIATDRLEKTSTWDLTIHEFWGVLRARHLLLGDWSIAVPAGAISAGVALQRGDDKWLAGAAFLLGVLYWRVACRIGQAFGASAAIWIGSEVLVKRLGQLGGVWTFIARHSSLLGAFILGYAGIAAWFAGMYRVAFTLDPTSAFHGLGTTPSHLDFFYFSLTTLATVGYGDITPTSSLARCLAGAETLVGIGWTTVVLAAVVSLVGNREKHAPGKEQRLITTPSAPESEAAVRGG